jgi:hypothetical protein
MNRLRGKGWVGSPWDGVEDRRPPVLLMNRGRTAIDQADGRPTAYPPGAAKHQDPAKRASWFGGPEPSAATPRR